MKIGITIDLSLAFWANGVQQNIVFLNHLFSSVPGNECCYISESNLSDSIESETEYVSPEQIKESNIKFDVIIIAGLGLDDEIYDHLVKINPDVKIILIHCFNKLMDDMAFNIAYPDTNKIPAKTPKYLSEIWVLPHHEFSIEYIKSYYNFNEIKRAPYLWSPFFINQKLYEMKQKGVSPLFKKGWENKVCIFEPNFSHIKNCLVPLMICEKFQNTFSDDLFSLNVFCCEKLRDNNFFKKFVARLNIINKRDNFCFFNNRWSTLAGLARWGSTVVSHQMYNSLNYAHLETLYLGLPLIHNSEPLMNLGYYYPDFDIDMGAKQLKSAIINHHSCIESYTKDAKDFIKKFDPKSNSNIKEYMDLLK